ncbi:MAG TPA: hypothetical protein PLS67_10000 [Accumulibacter sp.]|jgi:hypothetical protein|nr:hypothetical protein [Accumulibacter sp.]HQC80830.1 hypothetical protein [Accumulibacter sp.]
MLKNLKAAILGLFVMAFSLCGVSAHAAGVDLTALTTAADFSTTTTAILAIAAALMVVYIAWKAAGLVIGAVRRL